MYEINSALHYCYSVFVGVLKFTFLLTSPQGEYLNGTRNGYGRYVYLSGAVYTGEFKNDIKHGHGLYKYASEDMYEGE